VMSSAREKEQADSSSKTNNNSPLEKITCL
jgi:hypothetical protein